MSPEIKDKIASINSTISELENALAELLDDMREDNGEENYGGSVAVMEEIEQLVQSANGLTIDFD